MHTHSSDTHICIHTNTHTLTHSHIYKFTVTHIPTHTQRVKKFNDLTCNICEEPRNLVTLVCASSAIRETDELREFNSQPQIMHIAGEPRRGSGKKTLSVSHRVKWMKENDKALVCDCGILREVQCPWLSVVTDWERIGLCKLRWVAGSPVLLGTLCSSILTWLFTYLLTVRGSDNVSAPAFAPPLSEESKPT